MSKCESGERFLQILAEHGISADLDTMPVAMHRETHGGKTNVTFYGVGEPIPEHILRAIRREVFPLLENEGANSIRTPLKPVPVGEPLRRQEEWNIYCNFFNAGR